MKRDISCLACHFYIDLVVNSTEALYIVLSRLVDPCPYVDMVLLFGRSVPQLSMIFDQTVDLIDCSHNHRFRDLNQGRFSPHCFKNFCRFSSKGASLDNIWRFLDGTVQPCCRPKANQAILYNGHKRWQACLKITVCHNSKWNDC